VDFIARFILESFVVLVRIGLVYPAILGKQQTPPNTKQSVGGGDDESETWPWNGI